MKWLLHILFLFLIFSTLRSDQGVNKMWEIQKRDMSWYLLSNCRSISDNNSRLHCQCKHLAHECTSNDIKGCSKNCRCLQQSPTRVFYIENIFSSICVSSNEVYNQAGFSDAFLIYQTPSGVCATTKQDKTDVYATTPCNTSDSSQLWFWTTSGQIMNMAQLKCLEVVGSNKYRPLTTTICDSTRKYQRLKCNDQKLWFGISADDQGGNGSITHAIRYFKRQDKLLARDITERTGDDNIWTIYPTNNHSVCSSRVIQRDTSTFLITFLPDCSNETSNNMQCSKQILNHRNLSDCILLADSKLQKANLALESNKNGVYFTWLPDPFSTFVGTIINVGVECLRGKDEYQQFPFSFRVKPIDHTFLHSVYQFVPHSTISSNSTMINILNLAQNCRNSLCVQKLDAPLIIDGNFSTCTILWNKSYIKNKTVLLNTSSLGEIFQLGKDVLNATQLQWKSSDFMMAKDMTYNLTIYCYDNRRENVTLSESSFIVFNTIYSQHSRDSMVSEKDNILVIILPILAVMIIILIIIVVLFLKHKRKGRLKTRESSDKLHEKSLNTAHMNMVMKAEDNPCYEQCTAVTNPAVTIARNKLYEHSTPYKNQSCRPDSHLYEKPTQYDVKANRKKFEQDPCTATAHCKTLHTTLPPTPVAVPGEDNGDQDYDEPLGVIPSSSQPDDYLPYEKPLPNPPQQNVYDYATRENALEQLALHNLSYRSSQENLYEPSNDAPFYDVLDHSH